MRNVRYYGLVVVIAAALANCGGGGGSSSRPAMPSPAPANAAPTILSATSITVDESISGAFYQIDASDADGDTLSYAIAGGADANLFSSNGPDISFITTPIFSNPADADGNNIYELELEVSDGEASARQELLVTVTGVADSFSVRRIASGLSQPLYVAGRGDGSKRIFILEKAGVIKILDRSTGAISTTPFLDIASSISSNGERGLLGFALAPDYSSSGFFYVNVTNLGGDTEIRRYRVSDSNPDLADSATMQVILTFAQLQSNHNGGWIGFGADDLLYIATGDGGGGGDPAGSGQDTASLLGAMLRIDIRSDDFPGDPNRQYAIPSDNAFAVTGGAPEIWAYGLRNPFRASFDRETQFMYIGDVGQGEVEEIDLLKPGEAGVNFGWNILEGTREFAGGDSSNLRAPIAEYLHGNGPLEGNSVTGGYVYRGPVSSLRGHYLFGDFASNNIWSLEVDAIQTDETLSAEDFIQQTQNFEPDEGTIDNLASFGEDDDGNLYLIDLDGDVFVVQPN
ncbi:MAG: PQQ-dependent sugar dehydrogenase [Halioglobus sp.]